MTGSGFQICVLLARDSDVDGWMNLLLPVLVAIFWAIGGLANANKKRKKREKRAEEKLGEPRAVSETVAKDLRQTPVQQQGGAAIKLPPKPQKPASPPHRPMQRQAPVAREPRRPDVKPPMIVSPPVVDVPLEELPELPQAVAHKSKKKAKKTPPQVPSSQRNDLEAIYEDSDAVRMAILHKEILGKPVALRDDDNDIIGP